MNVKSGKVISVFTGVFSRAWDSGSFVMPLSCCRYDRMASEILTTPQQHVKKAQNVGLTCNLP